MLSFLKPRLRDDGLLAVCPDGSGVAAALITREGGGEPTLALCERLPATGEDDIAARCRELAARRDCQRVPVTSIVQARDYTLLTVESPNVPAEELRAAVRWRIKDLIDFPIDEAVVDVFAMPPDKGGREDNVYVVAARAAPVHSRASELEGAGLPLRYLDIPELAMRNVAALLPEDVGGTALLHLDAGGGLLTLTRQGSLFLSRRFEPGLDALVHAGTADGLADITQGRLDAVVIEVQRSLDYYESYFAQPPVAGLVVAPLTQPVPGLTDYLASQLGLAVRQLDMNELIDGASALTPELQAYCFPAIAAALRHDPQ
ncbi:MAG: hypothetical protein KJO38_10045 [Gammaproteobacteria bacterium]|nr:hypothetical protein [Gammaproteobacteria bacterium]